MTFARTWQRWALESGKFIPTKLPGCVLWLRADLGITLNGSTVSAWADQSGSGNNFSQGTAANQPTFTSSDSAFAGHQSVTFDGTNDYMTCDGMASVFSGSDMPFTVISAVKYTGAAATKTLFNAAHSTGAGFHEYGRTDSTNWIVRRRDDVSAIVTLTGPAMAAGAHVLTEDFPGTTDSLYVDGAGRAGDPSACNVGAMTINQVTLGAFRAGATSAFWQGPLAEIVIYNRALTDTERQRVQRYLGSRNGITVA